MKTQKIRTKFTRKSYDIQNGMPREIKDIRLTGRLDNNGMTYLRIADQDNNYLASLYGAQLYRLAKAIVARFEAAR